MKKKVGLFILICLFICASCLLIGCESKPEFTITVEGGTGGGTFKQGTEVTVIADEETDKRFLGWKAEGLSDYVSTEKSYTFTAEKDLKLIADYVSVFTVTVVGGTGGATFDAGAMATVTADAASAGKRFTGWNDGANIVSEEAEYTFTVNRSITLTAQYVNVYTVTVVNGTVSGNKTSEVFDEGTKATVTAEIQSGKNFAGWDVDGKIVSTQSEYTFNVSKDVTITATYKSLYTVTVENGTLSGGKTSDVFESGEEVTVTADDVAGKRFSKWTDENGNTLSENLFYTFTVSQSLTLKAQFVNEFTVTVVGGTLPENKTSGTFVENTSVTVTADEVSEATFGGWRPEGEAEYISTEKVYTFTVTKDVVLKAVYTCTVTVINGIGGGTYDVGAEVTVSVPDYAMAYDQEFDKWLDGENVVKSSSQTYTFAAEKDITLTPVFKISASLSGKTEFTDTYSSDADFAAGANIFSFPNPNGNIWKDSALSANSVIKYKECQVTFDYTYADNYGAPVTMVKVIVGDYSFIHFANGTYSFITLQEKTFDNAGLVPAQETFALEKGTKYNIRVEAGKNHLSLFVKANQSSEWVRVKTIECVPMEAGLSVTSVYAAVDLQNLTVRSYFGKHAVTVSGGTIVSGCKDGLAEHKARVEVQAPSVNENDQPFIGWMINGTIVAEELNYSFVAVEDVALTAMYGYVINVLNGTGGGRFASGTSVTVVADDVANGYKFVGWFDGETAESSLVSEEKMYTFTVSGNMDLVAKFERDETLQEETTRYEDNTGFTAESGKLFENTLSGLPSAELEYTIAYNETRTATTEQKFTACDIVFDMQYTNMFAGGASFSVNLGEYTFYLYCDGSDYVWFGTDAQDAANYHYSHPKETLNVGNVRYTINYTQTSISLFAQRWTGTEYGEKELVRKIVFDENNTIEEYQIVFTANHCAITLKNFTVTQYLSND